MDLNNIRSLVTLASLLLFLGLLLWTWRPARRSAHEDAARLPFLEDGHGQGHGHGNSLGNSHGDGAAR